MAEKAVEEFQGGKEERIRRRGRRPVGLVLNPKQTRGPPTVRLADERAGPSNWPRTRERANNRESSLSLSPLIAACISEKRLLPTLATVTDAVGVLRELVKRRVFFIYVRPRW